MSAKAKTVRAENCYNWQFTVLNSIDYASYNTNPQLIYTAVVMYLDCAKTTPTRNVSLYIRNWTLYKSSLVVIFKYEHVLVYVNIGVDNTLV